MYDFKWQSEKIKEIKPFTELHAPCVIGNGIVDLDKEEAKDFEAMYDTFLGKSCMFIPASGSGSRMFQSFQENIGKNVVALSAAANKFFENKEKFALYSILPKSFQRATLSTEDKVKLMRYVISNDGLNFGNIPKGLFPFHKLKDDFLTPFQEQVLQGLQLSPKISFHFTIQEEYEDEILSSIKRVLPKSYYQQNITFSCQDKSSDSFVFTNRGELYIDENGNNCKKPSGHGALLNNLKKINADIILVKNIDNIQHFTKSAEGVRYFKILSGLLLHIKNELREILLNNDFEREEVINNKYRLFHENKLERDISALKSRLQRPLRICGMVLNEGAPGGGPFWVKNEEGFSKQIVESAEVVDDSRQQELFESSTHFNPVFMVLDKMDMHGENYDLEDYMNPSRYLKVHKQQGGSQIQFIERPGLWNGSMHYWNTIFVEVPNNIFSPVKNVLDLLEDAHLSAND